MVIHVLGRHCRSTYCPYILPDAGSSKHDKSSAVDELISKLGLTTCQNNLVGGVLSRGISGGEVTPIIMTNAILNQ